MPDYSPLRKSSFGQRIRNYVTQNRSRGGGGGYGLSIRFNNRWRPPQNRATKARLIAGDYVGLDGQPVEYFPYVEHFVARSNKSFICSKQYKQEGADLITVGGKCLGCEAMDEGAGDISWRLLHAFNAIHLAYYHLKPVFDKDNKPIMRKAREGQEARQAMEKVECEGRRCKHCKEGLEKVFGKKVHWSVGTGHLGDLGGVVDEIGRDCKECGQSGSLYVVSYECSKCGDMVIDMDNTDLTDEQIDNAAAQKHRCSCGHNDFMLRQHECENCQDPEPLSIFDCDIEIKRSGEGTQSTVQIPRWTATELSKELKEMAKPYNFKRVFAADNFDWQAKVLKIRNPYGQDSGKKHSREYTDTSTDDPPHEDPDDIPF